MENLANYFDGQSPVLQFIGEWGYKVYERRELLTMYLHLIISSLFPIYIGSHASLQRPPSAGTPKKPVSEDEDDEIELEAIVEGLTPSDAILFPLGAGLTLGTLYVVIKWLNNPALLNKILNWYFCGMGVFSIGKFAADGLDVATSFIFPSVWSSRRETYHIVPLLSQQVTGPFKPARIETHRKFVGKTNPFPGLLSYIKFPQFINSRLWTLRALLKRHWILRFYIHGLANTKTNIKLNDTLGLLIGIFSVAVYNFSSKHWFLTNLMGTSFAYSGLQLISLTTFWTGTLVLGGLFFYDIVMVFYTPMMITVATTLEVPIKLVFPGPKRGGMLGLGDVVLPGLMIALALRFDLYMRYLKKQRKEFEPISKQETITRVPYVEATGQWGERFWTSSITKTSALEDTVADGARFPKPYFKVTVVAYILSMVVCLVVMNIFDHGQPALLYLVPGVLLAVWGTAWIRGEASEMWQYTEDGVWGFENDSGREDLEKKKKFLTQLPDGVENKDDEATPDTATEPSTASVGDEKGEKERKDREEHAHHVFLISLSDPKRSSSKNSVILNET